jgi:signal transduction histidine kinase
MLPMTDSTVASSSDSQFVVPRHNYRVARRRLIFALVVAITVPLLGGLEYAYLTYERAIHEREETLDRLAAIAEGKVQHIFDSNKELVERVEDAIGSSDEQAIRGQEVQLHAKLHALVRDHPFVSSVSVVSPGGEVLATSWAPAPAVSIGDREDFRSTRNAPALMHVSMPQQERLVGADIVTELVPRKDKAGRFQGAVMVSIKRGELIRYFQQLREHNPGLVLGLYRQDGGILARVPVAKRANSPTRHAPLANAFVQKGPDGFLRVPSPIDGGMTLMAYKQAEGFPVYVSTSYAMTNIIQSWLHKDLLVVAVALTPCVCLCLLLVFSLRQLNNEEAAWLSWRREAGKRQRAEDAARQLQRTGALGNLVASVAHDFNNLLMVVTANMEIARRKNYTDLRNEVTAVERASVSARVLARRLMSVSRKQPLQQQITLIESWLEQTEPLIASALGSKVNLHIQAPDSVWPVVVDQVELTSALVNIAVNSKDAMPNGGEFWLRLRKVSFETRQFGLEPGDYSELACTDTGIGMPEPVARQAFEPLFSTKGPSAGTGLGLAQVLAMAEQAGGTARLESAVNKGTTVFLYLPRWTGAAPPEREDSSSVPATPTEQASVLLVEDNEEVAAGLVAVLDVLGWHARHAPSGDAARKVLESGEAFDLVLSDIQMPGTMDGIGLAEWVRKKRPKQAITLMTGYADHLAEAKRLGVSVLSKPFNADDLSALLMGVPRSAVH